MSLTTFPKELFSLISSYHKIPIRFPKKCPIVIHFPFPPESELEVNYDKLHAFFSDVNTEDDNWVLFLNGIDNSDGDDYDEFRFFFFTDEEIEEFVVALTPFYTVHNFIEFKNDMEKIMEKYNNTEDGDELVILLKQMNKLTKTSNFDEICKIFKKRVKIIFDEDVSGDDDDE